jgi:ketosteroid isomerase-like protein
VDELLRRAGGIRRADHVVPPVRGQTTEDIIMTIRETIQRYFDKLAAKSEWQESFADDIAFTSYISPTKEVKGKAAYLEATKRFYSTIRGVELRQILVDGTRAVALTRYKIQQPGKPEFTSDVAEVFSVKGDKIDSLGIYFDTAPYK